MSGKIMGQVWDFDLPTNEQLILLAMADHADHEGQNIWPSIGLLAWKTGYSERTIQRVIKSLIGKNILQVQKRRPGKTTIYCTAFENATLKTKYDAKQTPDTDVTPDTNHVTPTPDIQMSPEPSLELSTKIKDSLASPDGNAAGDYKPLPIGWHDIVISMTFIPDALFSNNPRKAELHLSKMLDDGTLTPDMDSDQVLAVVKQELITPPDAAAQHAPEATAKKERPPNPWYDAVKDTMGAEGWRNGRIQNVLLATGKNGYKKYNLEIPLTDPQQVHTFWTWFQKKCEGCELKSPETVQSRVMEWQREGMPDIKTPSQPVVLEDDIEWDYPCNQPVVQYADKPE